MNKFKTFRVSQKRATAAAAKVWKKENTKTNLTCDNVFCFSSFFITPTTISRTGESDTLNISNDTTNKQHLPQPIRALRRKCRAPRSSRRDSHLDVVQTAFGLRWFCQRALKEARRFTKLLLSNICVLRTKSHFQLLLCQRKHLIFMTLLIPPPARVCHFFSLQIRHVERSRVLELRQCATFSTLQLRDDAACR